MTLVAVDAVPFCCLDKIYTLELFLLPTTSVLCKLEVVGFFQSIKLDCCIKLLEKKADFQLMRRIKHS